MASRTVIVTTCDLCGVEVNDDNTVRQDGQPLDLRIVVDGVSRALDLCRAHDGELLTVLRWHAAGTSAPTVGPRVARPESALTQRRRQRRQRAHVG